MNIEEQKHIADSVLERLFTIDPYAVVAGGAPRDWYLGNLANDIDVYIYIDKRIASGVIHKMIERVNIFATEIVRDENDSLKRDSMYTGNPDIRKVYNVHNAGNPVQVIITDKPTFNCVVDKFPLNTSMAWYKSGKVGVNKWFEQFVNRNAIIKMNETYADGHKYIHKILTRFPDATYYDSKEKFYQALL